MIVAAYLVSVLAIAVMAVDVVLAFRLKRSIVGGEVGKKWGLMTLLVAVFFVGYLFSPLVLYFQQAGKLPVELLSILVFAVFLFGAVFVYVVIGIIKDALQFLDLLEE